MNYVLKVINAEKEACAADIISLVTQIISSFEPEKIENIEFLLSVDEMDTLINLKQEPTHQVDQVQMSFDFDG